MKIIIYCEYDDKPYTVFSTVVTINIVFFLELHEQTTIDA